VTFEEVCAATEEAKHDVEHRVDTALALCDIHEETIKFCIVTGGHICRFCGGRSTA